MQFLKKFIHTIFVFFFTISVFAQTGSNPLIQEVQLTKSDSVFRFLYIYNDSKLKTLETKYLLIANNQWQRLEQTEWLYSNNQCTEQFFRKWEHDQWMPIHQIAYEYAAGKVTETQFDLSSGAAVFVSKSISIYDSDKISSKTAYRWTGSAWQTEQQTSYTYDGQNVNSQINIKKYTNNTLSGETKIVFKYNSNTLNLDSQLVLDKVDADWVNSSLSMSFYKPSSAIKTSEILKKWDNVYQKWINEQNIEYQYDPSNKLISERYQAWSGMFWKNDLAYEYQYDTNGALLKKTTFLPIYDDFRAVSSVNYSNFQYAKASLIQANWEFWGGETGTLVNTFIPYQFNNETVIQNGSKVFISYVPVSETGVLTWEENRSTIKIYPNPSKAIFYFDTEQHNASKWIVTDLNGKVILTNEMHERTGVIDLGDFKSGIYLLQVITNEGIKIQKLIKQ